MNFWQGNLLAIVAQGAIILSPMVLAAIILFKIDLAAKRQRQPVNVFIVDLFSLMFLVPIPLVFLQAKFTESDDFAAVLVGSIFSLLMAVIWWSTIRSVSKAGVNRVSDRLWIAVLVIPITFIGSFFAVGVLLTMTRGNGSADFALLLFVALLTFASMLFANWKTRNILQRAKDEIGRRRPSANSREGSSTPPPLND